MNSRARWSLADLRDPLQLEELRGRLWVEENLFGSCAVLVNEEGVTIVDPATLPAEAPAEEKSALDEAKDDAEPKDENGGAKPPEDGPCRECRRHRRLNRLRLCYACWVALSLADDMKKRGVEWKPGDKHPDWCGCEGLGEHRMPDGSDRGAN